ncbi:early boundary activity protein 1-like [Ostrinia furnacalis]|uniref:early boundary activity protein 1-like n=1 Tax=Ostrinia furnacalis TaxID=93504 RepID=UPI00103C13B9|nr:early boundary activity protein 1-like [Ostrinia furnacalis]XP_028161687.1 early boundary activity protein 1-like [Ostrinia furnacalis]
MSPPIKRPSSEIVAEGSQDDDISTQVEPAAYKSHLWNVRQTNISYVSLPPKKRLKFLTQPSASRHWTEKKLRFPKAVGSFDYELTDDENEPPADPVDPQPSESVDENEPLPDPVDPQPSESVDENEPPESTGSPVDPQSSESISDKENIELSDTTESESEDEDLEQEMARRKTKPDMMAIGDGHVYVPKCVFKCVDWTSHTIATRKLLLAVFPRRTLGTSSLTGKRSPAFPHLAPKKKLPAKMVSDIIQTVAERCRVSTGLVRTAITSKCADEGKLLRESRRN